MTAEAQKEARPLPTGNQLVICTFCGSLAEQQHLFFMLIFQWSGSGGRA